MSSLKLVEPYIGLPYIKDEFDCADFFLRVQKEVFGVDLVLGQKHRQGKAGQRSQIMSACQQYAVRIDAPVHGCAVLLQGQDGYLHIGTVLMEAGVIWVLHNSEALGSVVLTRHRDLSIRGMQTEGFYQWK